MGILKRGKVPEEIKPEEYEEEPEPVRRKPKAGKSLIMLETELEKVKARIQILDETKKAVNERLSMLEERIGELRAGLVEREKEIGTIGVKATKAYDMVNLVQPEKLAADLQKRDTRIEALQTRLETSKKMMSSIVKEMKDFRSKLRAFAGLEEVGKMSSEVREELAALKTVQARIDVNASKVEKMFIEVQKKYSDFSRSREIIDSMSKSFNDMVKEFNTMKVRFGDFITKKEFDRLERTVENQVEWIKGIARDPKPFQDFFQKIRYMEKESAGMKQSIERINAALKNVSDGFGKLSTFIVEKVKDMEARSQKLDDFNESLQETRNVFDRKIEDILDVIEKYADKVEKLDRALSAQTTPPHSDYHAERAVDFKKLRDYVKECMARGHSTEKIEKILKDAGYTDDEIRTVMASL